MLAVGLVPLAVLRGWRARHPGSLPPEAARAVSHAPQRAPVVSFFLDQPYIDATGLETPYLPPSGARSAQPLAELSEQVLRCANAWS